jgi:hypothetical protein
MALTLERGSIPVAKFTFCNGEKFMGTVSVHKTEEDFTRIQNALPSLGRGIKPPNLVKENES